MCSITPQEMVSFLLTVVDNPVVVAGHFWDCHRRNSHGSSSQGGNGSEGYCLVGSYNFNCSQTDIALDP